MDGVQAVSHWSGARSARLNDLCLPRSYLTFPRLLPQQASPLCRHLSLCLMINRRRELSCCRSGSFFPYPIDRPTRKPGWLHPGRDQSRQAGEGWNQSTRIGTITILPTEEPFRLDRNRSAVRAPTAGAATRVCSRPTMALVRHAHSTKSILIT